MRRIIVFNQITLDGYFTDNKGDMSWAHKTDPEWNAFVADNASSGGALLLGRVTYEMMVSFWPTPAAKEAFPVVADHMNKTPKFVLSRTLDHPTWNNTTVVKDVAAIKKLKHESGPDLVILGSGTVVSQLTDEGLIDEYQLVINPLALGAGRTLFDGIKHNLALKRTETRNFTNGNVLLCYVPA